jgi:hypothetical protein
MAQTKKQIADAATKTRATLNEHVRDLVDQTLDSAIYNQHGHFVGKQGPHGHDMVASDAHLQNGQFIPQACGKTGGPFDDNQRMADDYANADEKADD